MLANPTLRCLAQYGTRPTAIRRGSFFGLGIVPGNRQGIGRRHISTGRQIGVGRCGGIEKTSLISRHGGETDTTTNSAPGRRPERVDRVNEGRLVRAAVRRSSSSHRRGYTLRGNFAMHIIWTIIIGFIAGVIAKFVTPGGNEPSGFVLTTILGIVGAFLATYIGQAIGWYRADEGAGLIGAVVGAIIILVIWGFIAGRRRPSV
jgi:uncharacterized membrane protein YeaQ/YmgE (transglycosylase-associated protein family)